MEIVGNIFAILFILELLVFCGAGIVMLIAGLWGLLKTIARL